jgi:hypothetical protein
MDPWFQKRLDGRIKIFRIVWFALMASILIYGFILSQKPSNVAVDWNDVIQNPIGLPFMIAAAMTFVLSFILPTIFIKALSKRAMVRPWNEQSLRAAVTSKGQRLYRDEDIPKLLALSGEDLSVERFTGPYLIFKILRWALSESAAIFGFLLGSMMHSVQVFYPFAAVALLGMLMSGPSLTELRRCAIELAANARGYATR